ncbi:MAG: methyltransferase domain-containing protein [Sorangiineae bacterium]|nr:methyltransferase domain-containing protein [Polyangiaceae bacterium]MEB2324886.1 methyltransferase domain-containing protein [Sorangiineae bacterium]
MTHTCRLEGLPAELAARFVVLEEDALERDFRGAPPRHGRARTLAQRWLASVMSDFDANGLLGTYPMQLLSTAQWGCLLGAAGGRLLDVGAGNGDVTRELAPLFDEVLTTEPSWPMARRLRRRGLRCARVDITREPVPASPWATISCLNVLDRTARPRTLLARLRDALAPSGRLILSLVFPYQPVRYAGARLLEPLEPLDCAAADWETGVTRLVERELAPLGLTVERLARAPYFSGGDSDAPLYELDAAVLLCRRRAAAPPG